jgi:hypothetical protein
MTLMPVAAWELIALAQEEQAAVNLKVRQRTKAISQRFPTKGARH